MDDFSGILARDFGLRPQGKSAPMASSKPTSGSAWPKPRSESVFADLGLGATASSSSSPYDDVFGPSAPPPPAAAGGGGGGLDSIFDGFKGSSASKSASVSLPVFDKPVYDDDIFDGVPGVKSSSVRYDDVFSPPSYGDDLLESLGRKAAPESKGGGSGSGARAEEAGFDDLIPGFGGSSPPPTQKRETADVNQKKPAVPTPKTTTNMADDPFVILETTSTSTYSSSGIFSDPLEHMSRPMHSEGTKVDNSSADGGLFNDSNTFDRAPKSDPLFTSEVNDNMDRNPPNKVRDSSPVQSFAKKNQPQQSSMENFENIMPKVHSDRYSDINKSVGSGGVQSSQTYGGNATDDQSPRSNESADDVWLTVSEIPLFTQPTSAPPPSRPPPPLVIKQRPSGGHAKRRDDEYIREFSQNHSYRRDSPKQPGVSPMDELEDFAMGKPQKFAYDHADVINGEEEFERSSAAAASAAAMKEAMDKAEAKFKHAKELRERERDAKLARSRETELEEEDEEAKSYTQDMEDKEKQARLEQERELREREEREREQQRLERERELEQQRERERARQAVERATKEARERAAAEARIKAEREARQRVERAAVQRAQQEARERAATEARERAERAAAEARERAAAEARERAAAARAAEKAAVERAHTEARRRAERAAVERAAAEARERQAAEARERQAAAAREKQQKPENDLESFFGMGSRANSAPKQRAATSETVFDSQARGGSDGSQRASSASASIRKASSTTNIVDDLSAIFGAPSSSGVFQDIEGESEERRRARLERHQRTLERAAKALAEKNERDMQLQREQAERHRIAETLDFEIKRWAAGKEGNLRALLSTLQYVLWPECGWQAVSLTDLITAAAVKKQYRKATLCIHPDKVQQKGANIQQKYIAEKVFDLLKEAWNKFNSEELF